TPADRGYAIGADGVAAWPPLHATAWIGLLEAHKRITRALDGELEAGYSLSLSGLELLSRLAVSRGRMRLSWLAAESGLSLSRVSRIAVALADRGLIDREPCPDDARAVEAWLTPQGAELARAAQQTHFDSVQRLFFDRLATGDLEALAAVFGRLAPRAAQQCTNGEASGAPDRRRG
ncbi:MAG: MarR family winged helix-turn-helix transcriptional regulator, partial [Solirubrobacteraceae bacterium]